MIKHELATINVSDVPRLLRIVKSINVIILKIVDYILIRQDALRIHKI